MKKIFAISFLTVVLLLTGCEKKKLMCTYSSTDSYSGSRNVFFKYYLNDEDKIDGFVVNEKMNYTDSFYEQYKESMESEYNTNKEQCDSLNKKEGIKCSISHEGTSMGINVKYDFNKISSADLSELGLNNLVTLSYEDIKTQNESQGFTCK